MINYVNLNSMLLPLLCSQRNENKIFEMSFSCIQAAWREHPIMHFIEHSPNQKRDWITVSRDAFQTRWTYGSQVTTLMILSPFVTVWVFDQLHVVLFRYEAQTLPGRRGTSAGSLQQLERSRKRGTLFMVRNMFLHAMCQGNLTQCNL